jgi:hypothetical protein
MFPRPSWRMDHLGLLLHDGGHLNVARPELEIIAAKLHCLLFGWRNLCSAWGRNWP